MKKTKPFIIDRNQVMDAYLKIMHNGKSAGIDSISLADFHKDYAKHLYRIWNRMSSGSYIPPAVKEVEIPKKGGGVRSLGIPTVGDRIAQMVVKDVLEPLLEPIFHEDSYGYRPGRSAHEALAVARQRCWWYDWVLDLDIKGFFDNIPHDLLMKAVRKHTECKWVLLYIERWLTAPLQKADGTLEPRTKGTPQGSVISPLLSNLYLHYCFDEWMSRNSYGCKFERYADDIIIHCRSAKQAIAVKLAVRKRLWECGLEMHPDKTSIVYCKDSNRTEEVDRKDFEVSFDFLSYTFKPRQAQNKARKETFTCFLPAISNKAKVSMNEKMHSWRILYSTQVTLSDIAKYVNPVIQGWINYYGKFSRGVLKNFFGIINRKLAKWAERKFKRLHGRKTAPIRWLRDVSRRDTTLFAHWKMGGTPSVR